MKYDFLIIGAGLSGCVMAERLADFGSKVLIVDKRNHTGGNCHDYYDDNGILVHKYGAHHFVTDSKDAFAYLSQFTDWNFMETRAMAHIDGNLLPVPINKDTIDQFNGEFDDLKEKVYRGYTKKQWGVYPEELDKSVCERVPIRDNRDSRYFSYKYQVVPKYGYHKMFDKILEKVTVVLQADGMDFVDMAEIVIYTGEIDKYFGHSHGHLPYRSLDFEFETFDKEFYQPVNTVNYPQCNDFTRIDEFKHSTGQKHDKTTIVRHYPKAKGEPYYPVPKQENWDLYAKYKSDADKLDNVYFLGRLGRYEYINMDEAVLDALELFEKLKVPAYYGHQ